MLASASKLWNTAQGKAVDFGNLFHEMLSKIITKNDVNSVTIQYHQKGFINNIQLKLIKEMMCLVVNHPKLAVYFSDKVTVFNEREIVDFDNQVVIPDRLVFNHLNEVTVIDYKTGSPSSEHHQQLLKYERVLKSMGFKVDKKLLIYINTEVDVVEV